MNRVSRVGICRSSVYKILKKIVDICDIIYSNNVNTNVFESVTINRDIDDRIAISKPRGRDGHLL